MPPLHDVNLRGFASDNYAGAHPEVLAAIAEANEGHQGSYGADAYTQRLIEVVRGHFGALAEVFPVFNGTGANVTALTSLVPPADLGGLRRRTRAGNGRCQGFYCGAAVSRLLAEDGTRASAQARAPTGARAP